MAQTAIYGFQKPSTANNVDEEFYQLQETLDLLDSILAALQTAVNGKSATGHTHAISDVINLASELAAKMPASTTFKLDDLTDVSGADGAPNNYVLVKSALGWLPSSALAALGTHGHLISEITGLVAALADKADAAATTSALAGKADASHTHTIANVTDLQTKLDAAAPVGALGSFARNTAPTGWLKANGAAVSRTTYAALFTAIGTTFGTGDGSTTFNLPDLRGEFIRGWDDSSGVDSGRAFGSSQGHALQNHSHGQTVGSSTAGGSIVGPSSQVSTTQGEVATTRQTTTSGTNGTFAFETRPRNVALLICIKF